MSITKKGAILTSGGTQKAIIFAEKKHSGQLRKGTSIPYITHPMAVMKVLQENNCSEQVIIAGILHDTLEDTDTKPEEIAALFGNEILAIVQSESEDKSKTWKERKQTTIDHLKTASLETKLVCCADKLSNITDMYTDFCTIGEKLWERFNAPKNDIGWYYSSIIQELSDLADYPMYKNLGKKYAALWKE